MNVSTAARDLAPGARPAFGAAPDEGSQAHSVPVPIPVIIVIARCVK